MRYDDETVTRTLETSRDTLDRLQGLQVSEPVVTKEWHRVPEPEPEPRRRKLDTEPVYIARIDYLEGNLAEVLPTIDTMFQNINESWLDLKKRAETAEKQLLEVNKRLADLQRTHELDIRDVKLSIREERNGS